MTSPRDSQANDSAPAGRGPLARLIATRGGKAAPEAPFVIEHREALIYMLCEAAELEHGIMCQYLFAAFSLKQSADEGLNPAELEAVSRWRRQVSKVATQEMLHLALVHNVLSAIGAAPHLARPNLPAPAGHYPAGVQLALVPFGEQALRHFMFLERPEGMELEDADGLAAMGAAAPVVNPRDIVPQGQDFATVGHLYRSIEAGLHRLTEKYGEDWLFAGPKRAQATQRHFGWPELVPVTDLASACAAIEEILEQGEGPRGHWRNAHFGQFVNILDEYLRMRKANPAFEPVRPVIAASVRPHDRLGDVPLITDPLTARVTDLFNVAYEILLQIFERFFAHSTETDVQLKVLADATVALMLEVLKPLGSLITSLPAGPEHPGRTAGPSFELFYETDYLMPHREAAWALLAERLDEAAWLCSELCDGRGASIAAQLDPALDGLRRIAATLAAHLPAASPQAAIGARAPLPTEAGIRSLASQCSEILNRTSGATSPTQREGAWEELARAVNAAASGPGSGGGSGAGRSPVRDQLWEAVRAVTRRRAEFADGPGGCPPALAEAVAGLHDLAIRLASPGDREARLAELWDLQARLPTTIQTARNGPYLATNVRTLTDPLGAATRSAPQLSLCRCGASAAKPACDGTCHGNGFSDAKDPGRVPDRRDAYRGQQVTVFDNRGICQHSGFCTDRLPAVFRTKAEPFVAPSGGRMDEIIRAVLDCPSGALSYALGGREARGHVDWERSRPPAIEITQDGPYRVTGGIPLVDADGAPVPRAEGSSAEHYALCRCGHSQNKPFCSGMHWYVGFRDPEPRAEPTLFEHAGGHGPLGRTARLFYEKLVPADPLLAPVYAQMPADQPQLLAAWLAQALGGPDAGGQGSHAAEGESRVGPVNPSGEPLTGEQQARWAALIGRAADEAGLPGDPGFRSAFSACTEWLSRATASGEPALLGGVVPRWDWGPPGPPEPARPAEDEKAADRDVPLPGPGQPVSFGAHIRPLFTERDRQSMSFAFDLGSYDDVRAHADGIMARLADGSMPCDGAWPAEKIDVFRRWAQEGMPA